MKRFEYRARNKKTGKSQKGIVQADNEREAGKILIERGFIPDKIFEEGSNKIFRGNQKVTSKNRVVFTRQFATLIGAGLPLSNSLRTLSDQTKDKPTKAVVDDLLASVEAGKSLSEAMTKHPDVFNNVYLSLIGAGEVSGTLDYSLKRLADQEEKDMETMSKIKGALTYPAIVLVVIIAVMTFMIIAVVPEVSNLYEDMGQELPTMTKVLVGATEFFKSFWWLIVIVVGIAVFMFRRFIKTDQGRLMWDRAKLNMPMFGKIFQKLYIARFARTMEMLLASGVAMLDSIQIASRASGNKVVEGELIKAQDMVKTGRPLSEALKDREYMLPLVPQMASIGEESGGIDEMLGKAAKVYEDEVDAQVNTLSTMIEPILMLVMAGLILLLLSGTLLPIYQLVSQIS